MAEAATRSLSSPGMSLEPFGRKRRSFVEAGRRPETTRAKPRGSVRDSPPPRGSRRPLQEAFNRSRGSVARDPNAVEPHMGRAGVRDGPDGLVVLRSGRPSPGAEPANTGRPSRPVPACGSGRRRGKGFRRGGRYVARNALPVWPDAACPPPGTGAWFRAPPFPNSETALLMPARALIRCSCSALTA
jgi:hypothetical protein